MTLQQAAPFGWILDERLTPDAKLRQGDLIKFDGSSNPLRQLGIIVTADCDLEFHKHARQVTLVPAVTVKEVLEYYLLCEDCEKQKQEIEAFVFKKCGLSSESDVGVRYAMLGQIQATGFGDLSLDVITAISWLLDNTEKISLNEYQSMMKAVGKGPKNYQHFLGKIKDKGDLLVLPDPSGLGLSFDVAWMRHIWQVDHFDIAMRTSQVAARAGERIARLDSPFRYRLTQKMAQVFSDIGLPDHKSLLESSLQEALKNA